MDERDMRFGRCAGFFRSCHIGPCPKADCAEPQARCGGAMAGAIKD